jgi:hypothetical protein
VPTFLLGKVAGWPREFVSAPAAALGLTIDSRLLMPHNPARMNKMIAHWGGLIVVTVVPPCDACTEWVTFLSKADTQASGLQTALQ